MSTDPTAPRCEHGARWDDCYRCAAEVAAAVDRAAAALDTYQTSEAARERLRRQIETTRIPMPWERK